MPFGIPSEMFNGGFGLPPKETEENITDIAKCLVCSHYKCETCGYYKRCIEQDRGVGCVCDDCYNNSKFEKRRKP